MLFWGMLAITGLYRGRLSFFLLLPVAVALAYGLELGGRRSAFADWQPLWPLVSGLTLAIAVVSLQAQSLRWLWVLGVVLTGCGASITPPLLLGICTAPEVAVLAVVWCSVWGAHAAITSKYLLPNFQIVDWYRLWRSTGKPAYVEPMDTDPTTHPKP
jgi:hypothetical protein